MDPTVPGRAGRWRGDRLSEVHRSHVTYRLALSYDPDVTCLCAHTNGNLDGLGAGGSHLLYVQSRDGGGFPAGLALIPSGHFCKRQQARQEGDAGGDL